MQWQVSPAVNKLASRKDIFWHVVSIRNSNINGGNLDSSRSGARLNKQNDRLLLDGCILRHSERALPVEAISGVVQP
jgi:hypothetical protein